MKWISPVVGAALFGIVAVVATPAGTGAGLVWVGTVPAVRFLIGAPALIAVMVIALARSWNAEHPRPFSHGGHALLAVAVYQICGAFLTGMDETAPAALVVMAFGQAVFGTVVARVAGLVPPAARWPAALLVMVANAILLPVLWADHPMSLAARIVEIGGIAGSDVLPAIGIGVVGPLVLTLIVHGAAGRWRGGAATSPGGAP